MPFDIDVADRPRPELERHEPDVADAPGTVAVVLGGHDAALCRALVTRLGMPPSAVVRLGLLTLAQTGRR